MSIETYESEMHKKISDYNKWVNEHPIKSIEYMIGCKFKWHQKLENEILEKQCMRLLNNVELPSYYDSYQEMLEDEYYNHYVVHDDILYSINKKSIDLDQDIFNSHKNEDGSINFEVRYYNGGCGFDKAIEEALNNMELNK